MGRWKISAGSANSRRESCLLGNREYERAENYFWILVASSFTFQGIGYQ